MTDYIFHKDNETKKKKKKKLNWFLLHTEPKVNMLINPNWPELLYDTLKNIRIYVFVYNIHVYLKYFFLK